VGPAQELLAVLGQQIAQLEKDKKVRHLRLLAVISGY
jgi:hypothetical protein